MKQRKMMPHTTRWERLADKVARDYAPTIIPCEACGYPRVNGYLCTRCNGRGLPQKP